jgi:hypothetical protein
MSFAQETEEQEEMVNPPCDPSPNVDNLTDQVNKVIDKFDKLIDDFKEMVSSIFELYRRYNGARPYYGELEDLFHLCYTSRSKVTYEHISKGAKLAKQEFGNLEQVQLIYRLNVVSVRILPGKDEVRDAQLLVLSLVHRFVQTGSSY